MKFVACEQYVYLSLAGLRRIINHLNGTHGRWWLEDPVVPHRRDRPFGVTGMIEVFHSKGGPDQVTDELSFLVPVVWHQDFVDEDGTLVCLAPEVIQPGVEGLYLENGHVLMDCIADWQRFWGPLKGAVYRSLSGNHSARLSRVLYM